MSKIFDICAVILLVAFTVMSVSCLTYIVVGLFK